jgi:mycothiol system anti-sigma-R factor
MKERCREILERAYVLIDGEISFISETERIEIQTHLEECEPCFKRAELHKDFLHVVHRLKGSSPCPSEVRNRITNLLREI